MNLPAVSFAAALHDLPGAMRAEVGPFVTTSGLMGVNLFLSGLHSCGEL